MKHRYLLLSAFTFLIAMSGCLEDPDMETKLQNARAPEVSGTEFVAKTASTIELKASVLKENGLPVFECGLCWDTESEENSNPLTNLRSHRNVKAGKLDGKEFVTKITNLNDKTSYNIYAYAINLKDTAFSGVSVYTTIVGTGEVKTLKPDDLTIRATSAVVAGKIMARGEGDILEMGFYLYPKHTGTASSAKDTTINYDLSGKDVNQIDTFVCQVTDLVPETQYYVKAFARNDFGYFDYNIDSLTTTDGKPRIKKGSLLVNSTSYTSASLSAVLVSPGDEELTAYGFCWSTIDNLPVIGKIGTDTIMSSETVEGKFVGVIQNLANSKKYYARAYATNKFGTVYSDEVKEFSTLSKAPNIRTLPIDQSLIINGTAVVSGELQNGGETEATEWGICWSADKNKLTNKIAVTDSLFTCTLENLKGATSYYFCTYAKNQSGFVGYGDTLSFKTPDIFSLQRIYSGSRAFSGAFMVDNKAYIVGGDMGNKCTDELLGFVQDKNDPGKNEWIPFAPFKTYCNVSTCVDNNSRVYVAGGTDKNDILTSFASYDFDENTWNNNLPEMPGAASNAMMFAYMDSVYVIGGKTSQGNNTNNIYIYDVTHNSWKKSTTEFPVAQQNGLAVVVDDIVYAGLGEASKKGLWYAGDTLTAWKEIGNIPGSIGVVSSGAYHEQRNSIIMIDFNSKIWEYKLENNEWISHSAFPALMKNYHIFIIDGKVYILGQYMYGINYFMIYDPDWDN